MNKLIVIRPQEEPVVVDHPAEIVQLEDIKRHIGDVTADVVRLGTIPPIGRHADLWVDDEGLLKDDVLPNRELPNGTIICGTACCVRSRGMSRLASTVPRWTSC